MKSKKVKVTARRRRLIITALLSLSLASCGVTKATIMKPAEGTTTTVTITTNNPITTNTSPDVHLEPK